MSLDAFRQAAEDDDGSYAEPVKLAVNEILFGVLEDWDKRSTTYGKYDVALVRDEDTDELRALWVMYTVLIEEFKRVNPQIGERLSVKRHADGVSESGTKYRRFRVKVEGRTQKPTFTPTDDIPPSDVPGIIKEASRPFTEQEVHERSKEPDMMARDGQPLDQGSLALEDDTAYQTLDELEGDGDGLSF